MILALHVLLDDIPALFIVTWQHCTSFSPPKFDIMSTTLATTFGLQEIGSILDELFDELLSLAILDTLRDSQARLLQRPLHF